VPIARKHSEKAHLDVADVDFSPELLAEWLETTLAAAEQDMVSLERACCQLDSRRLDDKLMQCCTTLEHNLGKLNFRLLVKKGWAARWTGMLRRAQLRFVQQWREVRVTERRLNAASLLFLQRHLARQLALKTTVLDLRLKALRVQETLDTAQRCLETLSPALGDESTGGARYPQITDAQARMAHLQIVSGFVEEVTSSAHRSFEAGNALIEAMQWRWVAVYSRWQAGMMSLEEEVQTSEAPHQVGDEHQRGRSQLIHWLRSFRDSCVAYRRQEELLAKQLETRRGMRFAEATPAEGRPFPGASVMVT
jgi:hypothetical protein